MKYIWTNRKLTKNVYIQFSLIFILVSIFFFFYFILFKKSFLWSNDGLCVNYIKLVDLHNMIKQVIYGGDLSLWSWNIGLGSDVLGSYNSMGMLDPINIIAALTPIEYMDIAYTVSVYVHLYLAGITFIACTKEFRITNFSAVVSSICYTFSGWIILSGLTQDFFLIGAVLFPLLLMGFEKIINHKSPLFFIVTISLILITSPYHAFMSAFIMCIYAPMRIIRLDLKFKEKIRCFFNVLVYVLSGVFVSAIILLPTLYTLLNGTNDAFKSSGNIFYNIGKYYMKIPATILSFTEAGGELAKFQYSMVGVSSIVLLMLIRLIIRRKENKELFYMVLICLACYLFPFLGSIFNAFRYPSNRWGFILVFFLCLSVSFCLNINTSLERKEYIIMKRVILISFVWTILIGKLFFNVISDIGCLGVCISIVLATLMLNILGREASQIAPGSIKIKQIKLLGLVCLNLIISGNLYFAPVGENFISKELDIGEMQERLKNSTQSVAPKIKDNSGFYRVDLIEGVKNNLQPKSASNENVYFKFNSLNSFMPTKDNDWDSFNKALLISSNLRFRPSSVSNDNRSRLDTLMGVKYFLGTNHNEDSRYNEIHINNASKYAGYGFDKYKKIENVEVLKNKYDLGLGFVYDSYMSENDFMKLDYIEREQALFQSSVIKNNDLGKVNGINKSVPDLEKSELFYFPNKKHKSISTQKSFYIDKENNKLKLSISSFKKPENCELYLYFENLKRRPLSAIEKKRNIYSDKPLTREENLNLKIDNLFAEDTHNFKIKAKYRGIEKAVYNSSDELQGIDINDFIINFGYYNNIDGSIELTFNQYGKYTFDKLKIYAIPMDNYDSQAKKLINNKFNIKTIQNNYVTGQVNSSKKGILFLSIINNEGWSATVDGKPVETLKVNIGFTGIPVEKGSHIIVLKYTPKGLKIGGYFSMIGIILTFFCIIIFKQRIKHEDS